MTEKGGFPFSLFGFLVEPPGVRDLGMTETFRGAASFVIPEIFYQASTYYLSSVFSSGSMYSLRFSFPFDFFKGGYRGSFFSLY